jgi:hypothetical protein
LKDVIVGYGKRKMDKMVRRRELPYVRRSRSLYRGRVVDVAVSLPMKIKKRDEEAKKKQGKDFEAKVIFVP